MVHSKSASTRRRRQGAVGLCERRLVEILLEGDLLRETLSGSDSRGPHWSALEADTGQIIERFEGHPRESWLPHLHAPAIRKRWLNGPCIFR